MIDMHSKYYELICIICIVLIVCTLLLVSMDTTRIHTRELVKIVLAWHVVYPYGSMHTVLLL